MLNILDYGRPNLLGFMVVDDHDPQANCCHLVQSRYNTNSARHNASDVSDDSYCCAYSRPHNVQTEAAPCLNHFKFNATHSLAPHNGVAIRATVSLHTSNPHALT